ncbi:MAG TPA: TonB-dependent receptor [Chitinophagaceae bacterium]|nr:TonB-dependent receptor [Chitinophagaceae bacterium]
MYLRGRLLTLLVLLLCCCYGMAQQRYTISGYVRDSLSSESLIGASVTVQGQGRGVNTNQYGFYSITLPAGNYTLITSFVGYLASEKTIELNGNLEIDMAIIARSSLSQEIVISSRKRDGNVKNAQMGQIDLSMNKIRSLPVIFGEVDPLKALQLLPGVRNAGEGNSGLYVRGGGPDQNLILLDDAVVYNPGHLFGFFSVFNGDAIKNVSLIKGGMPAQYGGRLSSVLDIAMKDGNMEEYQVEGGIGTIASRIAVQGPIVNDKASFMVSGRRTYIDVLAKPFIDKSSSFYGSGYYFYDMNAKVNYKFSNKDRIYLSGYFGRDVFDFNNSERSINISIPWGNSTASLRWNHVFNRKLFANTTAVYNDYKFDFGAKQDNFDVTLKSGIRDLGVKSDFDYFLSTSHKLKFGAQYTFHRFTPSVVSGTQDTVVFEPNNSQVKYANELGVYIQDDWELSEKFKLNYGLRFSGFQQVGAYTDYVRDADGNKLDSTVYGSGQKVRNYGGFEPRITLRYAFNDESSFKAAITRNLQYIHLVTNAGSSLPTDVWVPSTHRVRPQLSWQYAMGYFRNFADNMFETSVEVYYKTMQNQIEYKEGYTPSIRDPEEEFVFGKGWSYGGEFYINKARGKLTGWIGYSLSWTWRQFPQLNGGEKFPAKYDRRHDLSVVGIYELSRKWKLSGVFVYATGNTITLPERFYLIEGVLAQQFSSVNQYRLNAYHRLDFSATYIPKPKSKKKFKSSWVFSIYNVYSRMNPYFIYIDQEGSAADNSLTVQAKQVSLFPIIPSVTWNFKF